MVATTGGVVVHDVAAGERLVGTPHVIELGDCRPHRFYRFCIGIAARHRACCVAGAEQHDFLAGGPKAASEDINDAFRPSIARRRDRQPGRCDQPDAHDTSPNVTAAG